MLSIITNKKNKAIPLYNYSYQLSLFIYMMNIILSICLSILHNIKINYILTNKR